MNWPWEKRRTRPATRGEAFDAYLAFMEGASSSPFSFPPGDYSTDQICWDVDAIIMAETKDMAACVYADRLRAFRERRAAREMARRSVRESLAEMRKGNR